MLCCIAAMHLSGCSPELQAAGPHIRQPDLQREATGRLFRQKADILASIGRKEDAHAAYSSAVAVCPSLSKAWLQWGNLCEQMSGATAAATCTAACRA